MKITPKSVIIICPKTKWFGRNNKKFKIKIPNIFREKFQSIVNMREII